MYTHIITVTSQKGDVGKATTPFWLEVGFKKGLLNAGDPQGSLTISMGYQTPDELTKALSTVMMAEIENRSHLPTLASFITQKASICSQATSN